MRLLGLGEQAQARARMSKEALFAIDPEICILRERTRGGQRRD